VEATKFTEVGFHGRDVDSIIRDLVDIAINQTKKTQSEILRKEAKVAVENKILESLVGPHGAEQAKEVSHTHRSTTHHTTTQHNTPQHNTPQHSTTQLTQQLDSRSDDCCELVSWTARRLRLTFPRTMAGRAATMWFRLTLRIPCQCLS